MSEWTRIRYETDKGVGRLTLARPDKLNALDPTMLRELLDVLGHVRRDMSTNVVVLASEGRVFSAGVDLDTPFFMENVESDSVYEGVRLLDEQHELIQALHDLPQPTVAKVAGDAVGGGGFGLVMACDMRFALGTANFWMVPRMVNVVQDFGLTWNVQRAAGAARTFEIVMSGDPVTGELAEAWGIVNRAFGSSDALDAHVEALAEKIAGFDPDAVRLLKHIVRNGGSSSLSLQLKLEAITNGLCFQSEGFRDAKEAYLQELRRRQVNQ